MVACVKQGSLSYGTSVGVERSNVHLDREILDTNRHARTVAWCREFGGMVPCFCTAHACRSRCRFRLKSIRNCSDNLEHRF